ncbi:MAG: hypothetical protein CMJ75_14875 [Planctomycetaceae bacterium]|nr:hypothetical protein [Planctomycetaceae bacterium]
MPCPCSLPKYLRESPPARSISVERRPTIQSLGIVLFASALALSFASGGEKLERQPPYRVPLGVRQLVLDDQGIAQHTLTRTIHRPVKRGAVIRSPDPTQTVQTRTAPVWDAASQNYKLWVIGIDQNLWESPDGLHWRPGARTNKRIMMAVYDPHDPDPGRRFKAPLLNRGFVVSADGIHWDKLSVSKIQSFDEGNFSYAPSQRLFIHTVKRKGTYGRALALASSRNFVDWDDLGIVFQSDQRDQVLARKQIAARFADPGLHHPPYRDPAVYNVDVYNMGVFYYEGVYFGIPAMYHATGPVPNYPNTVGFHLLQLAFSRDLKHWQRLGNRSTWIGPSRRGSGAYDMTQILPPSAPVLRGDELWFYYTGLKWRGSFTYEGTFPNGKMVRIPGKDRDGGAICLAVLRRDGFISLDAGDSPGMVDTRPFALTGSTLHLNVDAHDGEIQAMLLDASGRLLATAQPITGDHPQAEVTWQEGSPADHLGERVTLRLTLRGASLYSYWLTR